SLCKRLGSLGFSTSSKFIPTTMLPSTPSAPISLPWETTLKIQPPDGDSVLSGSPEFSGYVLYLCSNPSPSSQLHWSHFEVRRSTAFFSRVRPPQNARRMLSPRTKHSAGP